MSENSPAPYAALMSFDVEPLPSDPRAARIAQVRAIDDVILTERFRHGLVTVLELLAKFWKVRPACAAAGVSFGRVYEVAKYSPQFAQLWREAEAEGRDLLLQTCRNVAIEDHSAAMLIFLAKAEHPEKYRDSGAASSVHGSFPSSGDVGDVRIKINVVADASFVFGAEG